MIVDWLLHTLIDPVVAWIAAGLDMLPDMDGASWVVPAYGTLNRVAPVSESIVAFASLVAVAAVVFGVRAVRAIVSHFTGGGGVA